MKRWYSVATVVFVISLVVAGCSGGGGSSSTPAGGSPTASTVTGTAATGAPIAGATVTLVDSTGAVRTSTTAADGTFQINTAGLTPPFLLKVPSTSGDLYSVSGDGNLSTTVNLTPLSDIIVRSWYGAQSIDPASAFADPATSPPPAPTNVFALGTMVSNLMQPWLEAQGVNAAGFSAISTSFQAGTGTGIDGVISLTSVSTSGGTITAVINSGGPSVQNPTQQNIIITPSSGTLSITSTATTVNGQGSPTSSSIAVATTAAAKTALAGIFTTLTNIANKVNQKGSSLQGSDLAPYVDPTYQNDGQDAASWENETASFLATGQTLSFYGLQINSLDTTNNVADVSFQVTQGGQSDTVGLTMGLVGSSWLVTGNHHVAGVQVMTRAWDWGPNYANQGQPSEYTQTTSLVVQDVLQNNVVSATVSGPGTGNIDVPVPMVCSYDGVLCGNSHGSSNTQRYFQYDFSYWPAVGEQYTFTLTTASGGPYTYTATVGNEYGFEADGVTWVPADYPVITLTGPSFSFNDLTNGPVTVTGTVYIPIWSYTGIEQLHFNLQGPGGTSTDVSNVDINGTWTGTPVPGQANVFTMIIPQVTNNGDCTGGPYGGFSGTCYNVTFGGQTGDIQPGGWFGFDANNHGSSFSTSGIEIQ